MKNAIATIFRLAMLFPALTFIVLMSACGMVWKVAYTFPGTVSLEVHADANYPLAPAATSPATQGATR